jgi:hypothetical protein
MASSSKISSRSALKSYSKSSSKSDGTWFIIGLLILLIIVIIIVGIFYKRFEKFTNPKPYTLYYFYMDGCGHCDRFNPEWEKLPVSEIYKPVKINMNDGASGTDKAKLYNVKGAPTLILISNTNDKEFYEYNGNRTIEDINNFVISKTSST